MKFLKMSIAVFAMSIITACSSVGGIGPNEQIGAGVAAVTTVRNTADALLIDKKITATDAQNIQNQADTIIALLTALKSLPPSTDTTAKINQALTLLTALQGYLASKGNVV